VVERKDAQLHVDQPEPREGEVQQQLDRLGPRAFAAVRLVTDREAKFGGAVLQVDIA
jgi:hypothetical protein